jgi:hypothetical protein
MRGDTLASGEKTATFTGPRLRFDEGIMRQDIKTMSPDEFIEKYMITHREYDLIKNGGEGRVSAFAEDMRQRGEMYERELASDAKQEASLKRDCFIRPFVPFGISGRVIVTRDQPAAPPSKLALPQSLRKSKTLLPTTGHVIKANIQSTDLMVDNLTESLSNQWLNKRVLFGSMSGTAVCFKNYPTWIILDLNEILGFVDVEDTQLVEEELEPMV